MKTRSRRTVKNIRNTGGEVRQDKKSENEEFYGYIKDLVHHPYVLKMKNYQHHCNTSCYQHCLNVAYYNYKICKFFNLDARSAARAGMLHDLFLYDWHNHRKKTGDPVHAMTHPHTALHNAQKYFKLNALEKEMILKHMFPVTPIPPMHKETWIITLTDKYCGTCEIGQYYFHVWFPRGVYHAMKHLMKKIFGKDYTYADYRLPFGEFSEDAADRGVKFAKLRKRSESESEWKKSNKEKRCVPKY